ncbi:MAG: biotin transporter BioY [Gemmatimonadetes bacterium]|nr:biotin transporter BioY [Gemmatimonadota bacterium]
MLLEQPARAQTSSWATRPITAPRPVHIAIAVSAFVLATTFGAYVAIPLPWTPVPITLQPLFVLLAGALLGPRTGAAAMVTYLGLGLAGAPVFAGGGAGVAHALGPTGGYLLAYPPAAFVVGWLAGGRDSGTGRLAAALAVGLVVIYAGGIAQLAVFTGEPLDRLLVLGVAPFAIGDLIKILVGLVIARRLRARTLAG